MQSSNRRPGFPPTPSATPAGNPCITATRVITQCSAAGRMAGTPDGNRPRPWPQPPCPHTPAAVICCRQRHHPVSITDPSSPAGPPPPPRVAPTGGGASTYRRGDDSRSAHPRRRDCTEASIQLVDNRSPRRPPRLQPNTRPIHTPAAWPRHGRRRHMRHGHPTGRSAL